MPRSVLRVGTRGSALALAQAETVRRAVGSVITHRNFELVPMTTKGDQLEGDLAPLGGKGLFVTEIEEALASGKIDLAVHSAKDLPAASAPGVLLGCVPKREDPRDALLTRSGGGLASLQSGSTIGTASLRRRTQILALGRGFVPVPMRGNVDTRLRKLSNGEAHALIVALAGLKRMGRADRVVEVLSIDVMLPAPGQGALAVQCRANDKMMKAALAQLEDPASRRALEAERAFMIALGGDCNVPLAALAETTPERIRLRGLVGSLDGKRIITDQVEGVDPEKTGLELAERLRARGADEIIAEVR
ncbi:MAG: hydroxymethylbilane synthase [Actinomycetota bacterium]